MAAGLGFIGIHLPEEYGGQNLGCIENVIVAETMCRFDSTLGTALILSDLGCELIVKLGTDEQKESYLPKVASGESVSAVAFTEPARGSALSERLDTVAQRRSGGWLISGRKTLITNAPIAGFFVILSQTDQNAKPAYKGQSLFIGEADAPGVEVTELRDKMGIRASPLGELSLDEVPLSEGSILGDLSRGFYQTLDFINQSRVEIAAQALGISQGALDRALSYSREREVGGVRASNLQAVSHKLAEMAIKVEAARLLTYKAACLIDQGRADSRQSSMAKTFAGRTAVEVTDEAVQVLGGYGYLGDYDVERMYRDAKITEIYKGTREIQKNTVARFLPIG
jgi:alkylation response protein AidB-like acyl-CoA dehydrogenase